MLKKTIRRLGALAMVLAMAVSVFAVNASAANTANDETTFEKAFTKTVTTDGDTCAPATTFSYDVNIAGDGEVTIKDNDGKNHTYVTKGGINKTDIELTQTAFTPSEATEGTY